MRCLDFLRWPVGLMCRKRMRTNAMRRYLDTFPVVRPHCSPAMSRGFGCPTAGRVRPTVARAARRYDTSLGEAPVGLCGMDRQVLVGFDKFR